MCNFGGLAITDDDICLMCNKWLDEIRDITSRILIVSISIDDNISSLSKRKLDTSLERISQSPVFSKTDNMSHTEVSSDL